MILRNRHGRWAYSLAVALVLYLGFPCFLQAQEIAILKSADISAYSEAIQGFKAHLPPAAHITLEYDLQGDLAKGRNLARRIRASDANIVLAVGLKAALAAKLEILDIPVIFCLVLNPEKYGLPAPNMVGLSLEIPFREQVRPLKTLLPDVGKIGVLFDPTKTADMVDQLRQNANAQGIKVYSQEVDNAQEISKGLETLPEDIDALWLLPDSTVLTENSLDYLLSRTLERGIPVVGFSEGLVKSGTLVAAHLNYPDIGKQAVKLINDLSHHSTSTFLGTMVAPDVVHLSLNRKTAQFLGIPLSPTALRQFDEQF